MKRLLLVALTVFALSCSEEDEPSIQSTGDIYIVHEGAFGSSNATIGVYNTNDTSYVATAFENANGFFIGDVLQHVAVTGEVAYGVLNGSNKVEAFSLGDLKTVETLTDSLIDKPRYMAIEGDMAYVTIWGAYNDDFTLSSSKVGLINLADFTLQETIGTAPGVEQIVAADGKLYITRNYFGSYSNLSIIDLSDNSIVTDIALPTGPDELFKDADGKVWVACTSGKLVEISKTDNAISQTIDLGEAIFHDVDLYDGAVYYLAGSAVKKVDLESKTISTVISNVSLALPYALAINPFNGDIYLGDGVAFGGEGKVWHYNASGTLVTSFTSGILPTQFIFEIMDLEKQKAAITKVTKAVFPNTTNHYDTLFGGTALNWMDEVAFITATRYSRQRMVTVSSDKIDFKKAIPAGTIVELIGTVERVGRTSLEVLVEVHTEEMYSMHREKSISGRFTMVAIGDDKKPISIL